MSGKNVIVTGGAGFIGSHTVDRLLELGHSVTVIDNYSTGRPENLAHLKGHSRLAVVQADISAAPGSAEYQRVSDAFQGAQWVIHLAALADIVPSIERPVEYFKANVTGTMQVLEFAKREKVQRFVYSASSSCYGLATQFPTPEDAPIRPEYPYALTKRLGEELVMHWGKLYGIPSISLRFFNVYGPRSRTSGTYGAVFGVFLAQKLNQRPYTVVGDGTQSRDFTYVTDVVSAVVTAAQSDVSGEIMNVGSGGHYTVNRLVELLGGDVVHIPKRPGEPDITFADTQKISRLLNWKPGVSLEAGVAELLKNIDYWRQAPVWTPESIREATKTWFESLGGPQA
jgi:UDP-glucose 4-epimerase